MKIDVWSDFVCPFCYIGKRRLELALDEFSNRDDVEVEYKSYELDPDAEMNPGKNIHELLAGKYGMSVEKAIDSNEDLGRQAAELGLTYNFDAMQHTNTFDAHRTAKYASEIGKGKEMTERLMHAYFTESELISDHTTLIRLANEVGLDEDEVTALLKVDDYAIHVRADEEQARQLGVQGVPFFVFNDKYAVSGAQPQEVFTEVLEKVWEEENEKPELQSLTPKKSKTTYCTDEGCEVVEDD
ncbi:Predicted dithiol-disulfide isomerase, DsbA family [Lentibacillus halodurans]|uniref:Predicted dithiol-disulfide isomerase, DsbA family n=1 Tax=Lentibacillus halodurans TaxID=237679 RepID=A0A1I0XW74_9BACI|nr:DsbA family oxidoreductase [Lentibacillus halodurans]SFB05251.1 Predicted dithiol-disulfide isomerase, DsbA family [Lentibacillus halodurans]